MTDDGSGKHIRIRSALVTKKDGKKLYNFYKNNPNVPIIAKVIQLVEKLML